MNEHDTEQHNHNCAAYGCPFVGSMSYMIGDGAIWFCRYHFRASPDEFQIVTTRIRRNLALIEHCRYMESRSFDGYWLMHDNNATLRSKAHSFPGLAKLQEEDHWAYVRRLQAAVNRVLAGKPADEPVKEAA